ncbi:MAG: M48 family metalloprotease [Betaproteobacteria bacterium]
MHSKSEPVIYCLVPLQGQARLRLYGSGRAWIAAWVALAMAVAPCSPGSLIGAAAAQSSSQSPPQLPSQPTAQLPTPSTPANTNTGELRKYGSIPPESPPALPVPAASDIQKYGSTAGPGATLSPGQKLPDLGDSSQSVMSPAQERKLGEAIVREIRGGGGYLDDPEVNDYLNELGNRLVNSTRDARQDFLFFAVPDPQINAFALPGGFIGVNTGLIVLAQNESQLASVLAHEISHITQHHVTRGMVKQQDVLMTTLAGLALAILASKAGGGGNSGTQATAAAIAGTQALAIQQQINFTRENEYEADRIGFSRLVAAGFDPNAMAVFFDRLQRNSRFVDGNTPSYLRSHPITFERIAEAQARAQDLPYKQVPDSLEFHLVRALLRSYQGDPREQVASFDYAIADRKFNNAVAEQYGLVASLLRAKEIPRAKLELAKLEKIAPPHPMVEAMAGNVLLAAAEYPAAVARFESALTRYPNKMQLIHDYPEALIKAGRPADASAFVERQLVRFPNEGPLHEIAARAYAAQDKRLKQHEQQGEYYAWLGNLPLAISQFELAAKAGDGDFYQLSVVETRLRALRQEMSEQQRLGWSRAG